MKKRYGNRGVMLYTITVFLFSLALLFGCSGEGAVPGSRDKNLNLQAEFEDETVNYSTDSEVEKVIEDVFTTDLNFSPGIVRVTLNREKGWDKMEYTPEDFTEFRFEKVEELMPLTWRIVRQQIEAERTGDWSVLQGQINTGMLVNLNTYERIIRLYLDEKSKENVIMAINILLKRDDVQYAEPYYLPRPRELGIFPT